MISVLFKFFTVSIHNSSFVPPIFHIFNAPAPGHFPETYSAFAFITTSKSDYLPACGMDYGSYIPFLPEKTYARPPFLVPLGTPLFRRAAATPCKSHCKPTSL